MILFLLFVAVPLIEIALFVVVGGWLGLWNTLALVLLTALAGAALVSRQGSQVFFNARAAIGRGESPGPDLAHGAMILVAGAFLLTPGFLTDGIGFLLLIPAVREMLRHAVLRRVQSRSVSGHLGIWPRRFTANEDEGDWEHP